MRVCRIGQSTGICSIRCKWSEIIGGDCVDGISTSEGYLTEADKLQKKQNKSAALDSGITNYSHINIDNFHIQSKGVFTEIENIPDGFYQIYKSKGSAYYTNNDKTELVRVSDHWGYNINLCEWNLKGYKVVICWDWKKHYGKRMLIGIIKFSNMVQNHRKDVRLNRNISKELISRHPI